MTSTLITWMAGAASCGLVMFLVASFFLKGKPLQAVLFLAACASCLFLVGGMMVLTVIGPTPYTRAAFMGLALVMWLLAKQVWSRIAKPAIKVAYDAYENGSEAARASYAKDIQGKIPGPFIAKA